MVLQPPKDGPCVGIALDVVLRPVFARRIGTAFDILVVARDDGTVLYSTRQASNTSTLLHQEDEWIDQEAEEPHVGSEAEAKSAPIHSVASTAAAERESGSTVQVARLQAL